VPNGTWCRSAVLRGLLVDLAHALREDGALDVTECFIDASFAPAKEGGAQIGLTKRGKGVKILAIVHRQGRPRSVSTHAANHHEVTRVQWSVDVDMSEAKPEMRIGDRAYDSDALAEARHQQGIEMIAPHRANRKKRHTQEGRRLRRDERRWLGERFVAWRRWHRRLLVRWEYSAENCLGFIQRASMLILLRQF
jgi:Transposase DDE domain